MRYHARMARRAQHLRCSLRSIEDPLGASKIELCEKSERADNGLDTFVRVARGHQRKHMVRPTLVAARGAREGLWLEQIKTILVKV